MYNQEINIDILNFFRFTNHGVDMHQQANNSMADDLFNALQFAQSNPNAFDMVQWLNSPEWQQATQEYVAEIVGSVPQFEFHFGLL